MPILPLQLARVSNHLRSTLPLSTMASTQRQLLTVQTQLSTGVRLTAPSDDPGNAQIAIQLQRTLERREAYADNLTAAKSRLSLVDSTLGDVTELLQQVQSLASANVGSDVSAEQRQSAAAVVRSLYTQMLSLANRSSGGMYLFGGDRGTTPPYIEQGGGVTFAGTQNVLTNLVDESTSVDITIDGTRVFGGASNPVLGLDLDPVLTPSTRLADLAGAQGKGVRPGSILLSDGTQSRLVDLSSADTIGDVLAAINASGITTASLSESSIALSAGPSQTLTVTEVGGNFTARDLGLFRPTAPGPGASFIGASTSPRVTPLTPLAALRNGVGLDLTGGLQISNGTTTVNVSFTGPPPATTVQDLLNTVNASGVGALARVNAAGNGIDIVSNVQGTRLTVAENGGTLAAQLGVRTMSPATPLSSLNFGRGVQTSAGNDLQITGKNGATYQVDLDGALTVQDVINRINTAGGGVLTAGFTTNGNGITLADTSGGAGPITVSPLNASTAASDLGLLGSTATGTLHIGSDVNPVRPAGVFDSLIRLADALTKSDPTAITRAAEGLKDDLARVVLVRGDTGAKLKAIENRIDSLADQNVATQSLLSEIKDTDYPSAIAKFQTLQTTLEANYRTSAQTLQQSLLDFLR